MADVSDVNTLDVTRPLRTRRTHGDTKGWNITITGRALGARTGGRLHRAMVDRSVACTAWTKHCHVMCRM